MIYKNLANLGGGVNAAQLTGYEQIARKNQPTGYVGLDASGNLSSCVLIPRQDTEANLNTIVLASGEFASTTDTKKLRLGDGITTGGNNYDTSSFDQNLNSTGSVLFSTLTTNKINEFTHDPGSRDFTRSILQGFKLANNAPFLTFAGLYDSDDDTRQFGAFLDTQTYGYPEIYSGLQVFLIHQIETIPQLSVSIPTTASQTFTISPSHPSSGLAFTNHTGTSPSIISQSTFTGVVGATGITLGQPSGWIQIMVDGKTGKIPYY
jgi:hypothetical protein